MMLSSRSINTCIISAIFVIALCSLLKNCNTANSFNDDDTSRRKLGILRQYIDPATVTFKGDMHAIQSQLEINPSSTIAADTEHIVHRDSMICVRLKWGSRCPNPSLVGRLYGKSMTMLEWKQTAQWGEKYTEHCGSYENAWLDHGIYFLEVLIIHCNGFGPQKLEFVRSNPAHQGLGLSNWRTFDFMYECIEDTGHNRITGDNAYITINSNYVGVGDKRIGRWALVDDSKIDNDGIPHPQFTRYQPQDCRGGAPHCQVPMDNTRIDNDYRFFWRSDQTWIQDLENYKHDFPQDFLDQFLPKPNSIDFHAAIAAMQLGAKVEKVCIVGESHAHHMWQAMFRLNLAHRFVMVGLLYPELDEAIFGIKSGYQNGCKKFVIAAGQWASSRLAYENEKYGRPFSFQKFHESLAAIMTSPEIYGIDPEIQFYFRTIHSLPLGDLVSDCGVEHRPKDWRSPTVIDGYNHVIQELVSDVKRNCPELRHRLHFLDTRFINEPVWDTSVDFNHLHKKVGDVEALYVAGKVLLA